MKSHFSSRFDYASDERIRDVLVIYASGHLPTFSVVRKILTNEVKENLPPDELILLVRDIDLKNTVENLTSKPEFKNLQDRYIGKFPIHFYGFDGKGKISDVISIGEKVVGPPLTMKSIYRRIGTEIFQKNNGMVRAGENYHFQKPSRKHTNLFLRLSDVLENTSEISFLSIGLLSLINFKNFDKSAKNNNLTIFIDTPSVFSIVSALNMHLHAFFDFDELSCVNFSSYSRYNEVGLVDPDKSVFIISASTSGNLAKQISQKHLIPEKNVLHLFYLSEDISDYPIACNLAYSKKYNPDGFDYYPQNYLDESSCIYCKNKSSKVIPLVGSNFETSGPKPNAVTVTIRDVPKTSDGDFSTLCGRLISNEIFSVGLGQANDDSRARKYFIDPDKLLSSAPFQERLNYHVSASLPLRPELIIKVDDESQKFCDFVQKKYTDEGIATTVISREKLKDMPNNETIRPIVIVGMVIESGRTLQEISRDLRSVFPKAPQTYFIGLAKYSSVKHQKTLKSSLTLHSGIKDHQFISVEQYLLPSSSEGEINPWEAEFNLLNSPNFMQGLTNEQIDYWQRRQGRLEQLGRALKNNLYVVNGDEDQHQHKLQQNFAFWSNKEDYSKSCSEADVFFTVTSILQNLRTAPFKEGQILRSTFFEQSVLSPSNFTRFNDGVLQASFLRASHASELNYSASPDSSREMTRLIRRVFQSSKLARGQSALEFLMAIATHRLVLRDKDLEYLLSDELDVHLTPRVLSFKNFTAKTLLGG